MAALTLRNRFSFFIPRTCNEEVSELPEGFASRAFIPTTLLERLAGLKPATFYMASRRSIN